MDLKVDEENLYGDVVENVCLIFERKDFIL